ncbi:SGNH/GDSL hydrolase family protein [Aureliella helgolandensis]|uniref:Secreted protein n=1 Tax=Aureliella helgolandensis TaxID=2527968 RepID=A0A518G8A3_9BACT|nr:hypothetical protein [Aureliella helgolandensis]QDV24814.1 hypothetical protein Q31a_31360 [Aureliella helgolandensis]
MKQLLSLAVAVAVMGASVAVAADLESGLKKGEGIGAFNVTKCAGAAEDGVDVGNNLCYRCKNGARPQVMVFTRSTDDKVVSLVKQLDAQIKKNDEAQLRAFVNMLGESKDGASSEVKKLAENTKAVNVPFVVPNEFENGPADYGINPKAAVTIILANNSKVVGNFAVADAKELDVKAVVAELKKMLN